MNKFKFEIGDEIYIKNSKEFGIVTEIDSKEKKHPYKIHTDLSNYTQTCYLVEEEVIESVYDAEISFKQVIERKDITEFELWKSNKREIYLCENGEIQINNNDAAIGYNINPNEVFKMEKQHIQPVCFEEAIKTYICGETIESCVTAECYSVKEYRIEQVTTQEIKGKWVILI